MELALSTLAEAAATELHRQRESEGFNQLQADCQDGGKIAGNARREFEAISSVHVVTSTNYQQLQRERQRELQPPLFDQIED